MHKLVKIALVLIGLGVIAAAIIALYVFRKPSDNVADKKAEFTITCAALLSEFDSNEVVANKKYVDKIIEVTGVVAEISSDTTGQTFILRDTDAMSGVSCSFAKSQSGEIAALKVGETTKIKGLCAGYLMDVKLNKCAVSK
jgi:hypothetical protein